MQLKLLLVQNGEVFCPEARGKMDLLIDGETLVLIQKHIDATALEKIGFELDIVDASECYVVPGFIDPHVHLLGSSGESGFSSQTPYILLQEIIAAGVTTVVGTLGVDTATHTMEALLAAAKGMKDEKLSAFIYTGGYDLPPKSLMKNVRDDILYIEEVIGVGEIAISDRRSMHPRPHELARVVTDCHIAGTLSRSAGVTHFHVGEGEKRLSILRELLEDFEVDIKSLYPTHITRTTKLFDEAIALAKKGMPVDIDTVDEKLEKNLKHYFNQDGPLNRLTISSDAGSASLESRWKQFRGCLLEKKWSLETLLPLVTKNPAQILKLDLKGTLETGKDADLVLLTKKDLNITHLISRGVCKVKDGLEVGAPLYERETQRSFSIQGRNEEIDEEKP